MLQLSKLNLKLKYAEKLKSDFQDQIEDNKMEEMVQQSWNFTNDSMFTSLCLQWEPQIIAICMIYLAGKIQKVTTPKNIDSEYFS